MTQRIRRILVAIADTQRPPPQQLLKAAGLARAAGASLELFHVITDPDPAAGFPGTGDAALVAARRAAIAASHERRLERLARERLRGLRVKCAASWDYPPHEAIVRRALASRAQLVIGATRPHRPGARLFLLNTDWELIRHCPVPLLIVQSERPYRRPEIIAAVDPFHAHARPANLDAQLLRIGASLGQLLHGNLHVFHAYMPLLVATPAGAGLEPPVMLPPEVEATHVRRISRAIGRLAERAGVPPARRHVQMGEVAGGLAAFTRHTRADLVVMGAVSRSGLQRLFIGNAAERVLGKLTCDLLIVKPRGFRTSVSRSPAATSTLAAHRRRAVRPSRPPRPSAPAAAGMAPPV